MKLIKINTDHYVIVDDSEIKDGDWYVDDTNSIRQSIISDKSYWLTRKEYKKITHSTQPLYKNDFWAIQELSLSEVKELLGEVDVEKMAKKDAIEVFGNDFSLASLAHQTQFKRGYYQALEDNKDKKWTDADVIRIVEKSRETGLTAEFILLTLQHKTEWEVEFDENGKLKL